MDRYRYERENESVLYIVQLQNQLHHVPRLSDLGQAVWELSSGLCESAEGWRTPWVH